MAISSRTIINKVGFSEYENVNVWGCSFCCCMLVLKVLETVVRPGDEVNGLVQFEITKEIEFRGVEVELIGHERAALVSRSNIPEAQSHGLPAIKQEVKFLHMRRTLTPKEHPLDNSVSSKVNMPEQVLFMLCSLSRSSFYCLLAHIQ